MLVNLLRQASQEQLQACLGWLQEWNTAAPNCHAAHAVLHAILLSRPPQVPVCPRFPHAQRVLSRAPAPECVSSEALLELVSWPCDSVHVLSGRLLPALSVVLHKSSRWCDC